MPLKDIGGVDVSLQASRPANLKKENKMKTFKTDRSIDIEVTVEHYSKYRKSPDPDSPDDDEECDVIAYVIEGEKKVPLTQKQIAFLGLEQEAIDNIKEDTYADYDRIIDERPITMELQDRLKEQIMEIQRVYRAGMKI